MTAPAMTGHSVATLRARIAVLEALAALRHDSVAGAVAGAAGQATLTFASAFETPPRVIGETTIANGYIVIPIIGTATKTNVAVTVYRSRGTLLLSAGPFELAPAGTPVKVTAIGR